jgi:hypothetical protein
MPADKRPLKVFLCHARSDRDAVHALYARLTKDGVDAWLDKEKNLVVSRAEPSSPAQTGNTKSARLCAR